MLSQGYLDIIKKLHSSGNIYVENVRSAYNISSSEARVICEVAVEDGIFDKKIGFVCPNPTCHDRIISEFNFGDTLPETIICSVCESEGNDVFEYATKDLKKVIFYKLKK